MSKKVIFLSRGLQSYRVPFHNRVRERLRARGVEYIVAHGGPNRREQARGDAASLPWGQHISTFTIGARELVVQIPPAKLLRADLVITQQENRICINYLLHLLRKLRLLRMAYWGHGRNFQATNPRSRGESFKKYWVSKVDWWFAYTRRSAAAVQEAGFPSDRITVFNNAIDVDEIRSELANVDAAEAARTRDELFQGSVNVGVYIGALYGLKRIEFLLAAAREVRRAVPDFHLLIIGGGTDLPLVLEAAAADPWIHAVGSKFGGEKTLLASLGRVFLMPGLVGLAVLDSFAYRLPMVTTNVSYHSPEIDYLISGENGILVEDPDSKEEFANAVVRILTDDDLYTRLCNGGERSLQTYTIDAMAEHFSDGVCNALGLTRESRNV